MILGTLATAYRYSQLNDGFAKAFEFIARSDLAELPPGKYPIDGDAVYAIVAREQGRRKEDSLLETHEKQIDIQFVLAGTDTMGWKPRSGCKHPTSEYDPKSDVQLFTDEPDAWFNVTSGAFAIFFPEDAHMPLISSGRIHKVIIKVAQ